MQRREAPYHATSAAIAVETCQAGAEVTGNEKRMSLSVVNRLQISDDPIGSNPCPTESKLFRNSIRGARRDRENRRTCSAKNNSHSSSSAYGWVRRNVSR